MWLIRLIIDGSNKQEEIYEYFPGDDLFTPFTRRRGIPIGNLTSQFFANIYLNDLDHFVKETLKCRCYIRYVDDITVFNDDKKRLREIKSAIETFLGEERLVLHRRKTYVAPASTGIDHLGYRIFPTHRLLRKDNSMAFAKKLRYMAKLCSSGHMKPELLNASIQSWLGHAKHADTYGLRWNIFSGITCFYRSSVRRK